MTRLSIWLASLGMLTVGSWITWRDLPDKEGWRERWNSEPHNLEITLHQDPDEFRTHYTEEDNTAQP